MKILICIISAPFRRIALANAAEAGAQFFGAANAITIDDAGWAIIPFSESKHPGNDAMKLANAGDKKPVPVVQRFDRAAAEEIVRDFKSSWSRFKRAVVGLPIFRGHPDVPIWAKRFPDKTPRGTIADMEVRDDGLAFKPVLTDQGASEVSSGWTAFSPFWDCRITSEDAGSRTVSPFKLFSIGLLPPGRENIPGLSLANAAEPPDTMNPHLIRLLATFGIQLAADANDAAAGAAVDQALPKFAAANAAETQFATLKSEKSVLEGQLAAANAAKTALEGEKTALANAKAGLETQIAQKDTAIKAERTGRARLVVSAAVQAGKIRTGDLESQTTALANAADFDAEVRRIEGLKPGLQTASRLTELGKEQPSLNRQNQVIALVNAKMQEADIKALPQHQQYDAAFEAVSKDQKNAAIFSAMKKPGSAA